MLGLSVSEIIFTILLILCAFFIFHNKSNRVFLKKKGAKIYNKKVFDIKFCSNCRSYVSYEYDFDCKVNNCPWS